MKGNEHNALPIKHSMTLAVLLFSMMSIGFSFNHAAV